MKTNVAETSLAAYWSTPAAQLKLRQQEIMILFNDDSVILSRQQVYKILQEALGDSAPGEGGVCGRCNALVAAGHLVVRGERIDPKTRKPQGLLGLPVRDQRDFGFGMAA